MAELIGNGIKYKSMTSNTLDLNNVEIQSNYLVYSVNPNSPSGMGTYGYLLTLPAYDSSYMIQFLVDLNSKFFVRTKSANNWNEWKAL